MYYMDEVKPRIEKLVKEAEAVLGNEVRKSAEYIFCKADSMSEEAIDSEIQKLNLAGFESLYCRNMLLVTSLYNAMTNFTSSSDDDQKLGKAFANLMKAVDVLYGESVQPTFPLPRPIGKIPMFF